MQSSSILSKQSLSIPSKNISSLSLIPLLHIVDWILLISTGVPLFPFNHYMHRQGVSPPCTVCAAVKDSGLLCAAHHPGEDIAHPMDTWFRKKRKKMGLKRLVWGERCSQKIHLSSRLVKVRSLSFQPTHVLLQADVLLKLPMPVPPLSASPAEKPESLLRSKTRTPCYDSPLPAHEGGDGVTGAAAAGAVEVMLGGQSRQASGSSPQVLVPAPGQTLPSGCPFPAERPQPPSLPDAFWDLNLPVPSSAPVPGTSAYRSDGSASTHSLFLPAVSEPPPSFWPITTAWATAFLCYGCKVLTPSPPRPRQQWGVGISAVPVPRQSDVRIKKLTVSAWCVRSAAFPRLSKGRALGVPAQTPSPLPLLPLPPLPPAPLARHHLPSMSLLGTGWHWRARTGSGVNGIGKICISISYIINRPRSWH